MFNSFVLFCPGGVFGNGPRSALTKLRGVPPTLPVFLQELACKSLVTMEVKPRNDKK